jgi:hypothetical protein
MQGLLGSPLRLFCIKPHIIPMLVKISPLEQPKYCRVNGWRARAKPYPSMILPRGFGQLNEFCVQPPPN